MLVVAGGDAPTAVELADEREWEWVVAADAGLDHAYGLGLEVDLVVGDLDSVTSASLDRATASGVEVQRHPRDKDATDLALALDAAVERGACELLVVGVGGGRPDHELANLLLLAAPVYAAVDVEARTAAARFTVVRSRPRRLLGRPGDVVTLLAVHGPALGVRTEGLRWSLEGDALEAGSIRGVSNELSRPVATVVVGTGVLLAIQPR